MNALSIFGSVVFRRALTLVLMFSFIMSSLAPCAIAQPGATNNAGRNKSAGKVTPAVAYQGGLSARARAAAVKGKAAQFSLGAAPTDEQIRESRAFKLQLAPMSTPPVAGENEALSKALITFKSKGNPEDVSDLEAFLKAYPKSRWRAAIETNVGLLRFETGYLDIAIKYWTSAWQSAKNEKEKAQKLIADRAVSELLLLNARVGRADQVRKYLDEIKNRPFKGGSAQRVDVARGALQALERSPETAYKCGPFAVNSILNRDRKVKTVFPLIEAVKSTSRGTNMLQVKRIAKEAGLDYQVAKRQKGAPVIVPSIMHWKVGHYTAITDFKQGRYHAEDPTFGVANNLWISSKAIDDQTDGYFLIPAGVLPSGWQTVTDAEAEKVWGKGVANNRDEGKPPSDPKNCPGGNCCGPGMAQASAFTMQAELNIADTPLGYSPPVGPAMNFSANYNQNEEGDLGSFSNLGDWWSFNWVSWIELDASQNATVYVRGGGNEKFAYTMPDNVTNPYKPARTSQAVLTLASAGVYHRMLPDGTIEVFSLADPSGRIFMTQVIDPQGNAASVTYNGSFLITAITDAQGRSSTLTHSGTLITSVTDPFGRTATFSYVSGVLQSITDAVGVVSQFAYEESSSFIKGLTTPYGTTTFYSYTPSGGEYAPRGLRFNFPDGTSSVIENWLDHDKITYFWDRHTMQLYPDDPGNHVYSHAQKTGFLRSPASNTLSPVPSYFKPPLEAQLTYSYEGETGYDYVGDNNLPIQTMRVLSGTPVTNAGIAGLITAGDVLTITVFNSGLPGGKKDKTYTVLATDTTSTIAAAFASLINSDTDLQAENISASTYSSVVSLKSASTNATTYAQSTNPSSTVTITLTQNVNLNHTATIGGTVTAGGVITLTVSDASLASGTDSVSYTVQSGDTTASIAVALASAVNAKSTLQAIGVSASSASNVVTLKSLSTNLTGYGYTLSTGATETVTIAQASNSDVQVWSAQYNSLGGVTKSVDPLGRTFSYFYSANEIDLLEARETKGTDNFLLGKWIYNDKHLPTKVIDGSGQVTELTYNSAGQVLTVENALGDTTTMSYGTVTTATVGGTIGTGVSLTITVINASLPGGQQAIPYTTQAGDTAAKIASQFASLINANANLQNLGVAAAATGAVISMTSQPTTTTYSKTVAGAITITLGPVAQGYLVQVTGPSSVSQDVTTFTWNGPGTTSTTTSSEGYKLSYSYDNLDRLLQTTYPDGTSDKIVYDRMDAVFFIDRLGRTTRNTYDSMDQLVSQIDPLGRKTEYTWCSCGSLSSLTDASNHTTTWGHDLQGRVTSKTYADSTATLYEYETATSRLKKRTDARNQKTNYTYNLDDSLASITYTDAVNATPEVHLTYDATFPRITNIQTGTGGSAFNYGYSYNPYITDPFGTATTGGGRLQQITNSLIANATITFEYDALGRMKKREINGSANSAEWFYDAIGRVTQEDNALGSFTYSYLNANKGGTRLSQIAYPNGQTANFGWYGNEQDQRLKEIKNLTGGSNPLGLSRFSYAYNPVGEITRWLQQQYQTKPGYALKYDNAGQLIGAAAGAGKTAPDYTRQYYYDYDPAANRTVVQRDSVEYANIGGTVTASDVLTITVKDSALSGGQQAVNYTVVGGDTLTSIAAKLAAAITANANMQAIGVNATSNGTTINLRSVSANETTYAGSTSGGATETIAIGVTRQLENITIGGSAQTGDVLTITVRDASLSGGQQNVAYTVQGGDTLAVIATQLAAGFAGLGANFSATANDKVITVQSLSPNVTNYTSSITGSTPTETISIGAVLGSNETVLIGGTVTAGNVATLTALDAGLAGGQQAVSYTVQGGDTLPAIATGLAAAVNANANLKAIGVTATATGPVVALTSSSVNATNYLPSKSASATLTMLMGLPANGTSTAAIGGTITSSDVLTITVHDASLPGGSQAVNYTVQPGDTLAVAASGLASAINSNANLTAAGITANAVSSVVNITSASRSATTYVASTSGGATETITLNRTVGVTQASFNNVNQLTGLAGGGPVRFVGTTDRPVQPVTINSGATVMPTAQSFRGNPSLSVGGNSVSISATSGGGTNTMNAYEVSVTGPGSTSLTYDANGNMTSDGTNTYEWDAENRLIKITYPGTNNRSEFTYDALGRNVKIVEVTAGSTTSTKQFVWCGNARCEERDGSAALTKQFFGRGQKNSSALYFYSKDHLGSIREMTDNSAVVQAQYIYSPYGQKTVLSEAVAADFGYAGMYQHARSGLDLTLYRQYNAGLGVWLSRDPIGGRNLYGYVGNEPISFTDPLGLYRLTGGVSQNEGKIPGPPGGGHWQCNGKPLGPHSPGPPVIAQGNSGGGGGDGGGYGGGLGGGFGPSDPLHDQAIPDPAIDLLIAGAGGLLLRAGLAIAGSLGVSSASRIGAATAIDFAGETYGAVGSLSVSGNVATASVTAVANEGGAGFFSSMVQLRAAAVARNANTLVLRGNAIYNDRIVDILVKRYGGVITAQWVAGGKVFSDVTVVMPIK